MEPIYVDKQFDFYNPSGHGARPRCERCLTPDMNSRGNHKCGHGVWCVRVSDGRRRPGRCTRCHAERVVRTVMDA